MDDNDFSFNKSMNRREMLKMLGGLTAGAFASTFTGCVQHMPDNVKDRLKDPPDYVDSLEDIEHVVLLMQENRSFDHYFGTLSGVRGFDDPDVLTMENGRSVFHQPDLKNPDSYLLPFRLNTTTSSAQKIPSTSHAWGALHDSWNHGQMNQWISAHMKTDGRKQAPYVMGYYTREDLPFQYSLADLFTICDGYHASMLGPTGPNRVYWMTGTIDPEGQYGGPMIHNHAPAGGYRWKTYPERLEEAGISWQCYQNKHRSFNNLRRFQAFKYADKDSSLYQRGMAPGTLGRFKHDAANDELPKVSWVFPRGYQSEHPDHWPAYGAQFVSGIINAIAANPDVWAKTIMILNFDENDGIFDHVVPPVPPKGTPGEFVNGLPIGAGVRVPCIIISPYTAGGWVSSKLFDHTSVLQFLEKFTGVREPNISQWRRNTFGDFTSVFRFGSDPETPPLALPGTRGIVNRAKYQVNNLPRPTIPGAKQTMPHQEPGERKHLPVD